MATARLYERRAFGDISFALITKEAKFTRSNLYKYFNTKEEIFLELLGQDLVQYSRDLVKALGEGEVRGVREFAHVWANTLIQHERMLRLFAILYTAREKNSSLERLARSPQSFASSNATADTSAAPP